MDPIVIIDDALPDYLRSRVMPPQRVTVSGIRSFLRSTVSGRTMGIHQQAQHSDAQRDRVVRDAARVGLSNFCMAQIAMQRLTADMEADEKSRAEYAMTFKSGNDAVEAGA